MTSAAVTPDTASRPKVHRLPPRAPESRKHQVVSAVMDYGTVAKFAFSFSSVALVIVLSVLFADRMFPTSALHQNVVVKTAIPVDPTSETDILDSEAKPIILKEKEGTIVGQMAKIVPAAPATDAGTSEIDNRKGRELLSIVNKY